MNSADHQANKPANPTGKLPSGALFECEGTLIAGRRAKASLTHKPGEKPQQLIGIALSGGGIRSATFCLGLFQALAKQNLLKHVDYLSTVSGGGYFGSFLGRMFTRDWVNQPLTVAPSQTTANLGANLGVLPPLAGLPPAPTPAPATTDPRAHREWNKKRFLENLSATNPPASHLNLLAGIETPSLSTDAIHRVEAALADSQSPPLIWLRESGNYLAPGGANDAALDLSIYLRNWLSLLVVLLTTVLTLFIGFNCLRFSLATLAKSLQLPDWENKLAGFAGHHLWWTPAIVVPALVAVFFLVPLAMAYWLTQSQQSAKFIRAAYWLLIGVGVMGDWRLTGTPGFTIVVILMLVITMLWNIRFECLSKHEKISSPQVWIRNRMAQWLRVSLLLTVATFLFALVDGWGQSLYAIYIYAGGWHQAMPALAGLLGFAALAPVVRSLVLGGKGSKGMFKVPFQYLALAISLVVIFALLISLAFISHSLAWNWKLPHCPENCAQAPELETNNPGGRLYTQWVTDTNSVRLNSDRLIQVAPSVNLPKPAAAKFEPDLPLLWLAFGLCAALSWLFGRSIGFLNLSSYHTLYSARLTRAYQGASDQKRWEKEADVTVAESEDNLEWSQYKPHEHGGPLHLINCTINCTKSVENASESTTAKGLNLCVGPAGIIYGQNQTIFDSGVSPEPDTNYSTVTPVMANHPSGQQTKVEALALGDWVGISGAAFTTGLGNVGSNTGTTLGTSLLCGLFNVRLGYWWENHFSPSQLCSFNNLLPVQSYLANEFFASFHIVHRDYWYLSDGGHFENTAAYELIRRHVPFIILADCGADPNSAFDDLGNLIRRVRIDFGAELVFLDAKEIREEIGELTYIGTIDELRAKTGFTGRSVSNQIAATGKNGLVDAPRMTKHAAVAKVKYLNGEFSYILVIKPGLTGDETEDLVNYQINHPTFPQQNTAEQFYNEVQWESYRKLGQHTMECVLKDTWVEAQLKMPAPPAVTPT